MSQWSFVIAAYAVVLSGVGTLLGVTIRQCRSAESKAEGLGRRP